MQNTVLLQKLLSKGFAKGLLGAGLLLLSACSSFDTGLETPMTCPSVKVLEHSDKIVRFEGAQQPQNTLFTGKIEKVTGQCRLYDGTLHIQLTLEAYLRMGLKADTSVEYKSPFYITVTDMNNTVIQRVTIALDNKWNGRVGTVGQRAVVTIPMDDPNEALNYQLYVGYDVTPEELEYIRSQD